MRFIYNLIALKIAETRHGLGSRIAKNIATFRIFLHPLPLRPFISLLRPFPYFFSISSVDDDDDAEHQANGEGGGIGSKNDDNGELLARNNEERSLFMVYTHRVQQIRDTKKTTC